MRYYSALLKPSKLWHLLRIFLFGLLHQILAGRGNAVIDDMQGDAFADHLVEQDGVLPQEEQGLEGLRRTPQIQSDL